MRRREIARKFDEIVAFAEVERFIDTPVKRYSSGMYLRLAFAVAAHLEPEILLVDEVLAVGDAAFQRKCLGQDGRGQRRGPDGAVRQPQHGGDHVARDALPLARRRAASASSATRARSSPTTSARDAAGAEPGFADLTDPKLRARRAEADAEAGALRARPARRRLRHDDGRLLRRRADARRACAALDDLGPPDGGRLQGRRSLEGTLVFALASGELEVELEPGPRTLPIDVPSLPLRRGTYPLDLYVIVGSAQDDLRGAIEFEVVVSREPDGDPRRVRDNLGLVSVEQEWGELRQGTPNRV